MASHKISSEEQSKRQKLIREAKEIFKEEGGTVSPRIDRLTKLFLSGEINGEKLKELLDIDTLH
ncbi:MULTISPECIES: hypothetical protein [Xanthomonas]|uniref:Antitoxin VbhA domain-containing protein n=1 Tax=Xanthomonas manihotis TaxID=43353 RepID=A0A8I2BUC8_XANMN|nr:MULTISPECIES: hypothetical protein [Xanthomonas]MBO9722709.1 hypothetical protein [Xanthomonas phaseoli pv. manihotis]MBO9759028.1 hypothetical protein [Xanthomonas phaseoli pv. manihotis]MBO9783704.1 hypothetical protein [Xanthomonas phaseoli pv. manihotis]QOY21319.1 hypothetical protein FYK61_07690 [Xanthomonas citri]QQK67449.1 hypothetical protein G3566_07675 [Xanthomonas citri]